MVSNTSDMSSVEEIFISYAQSQPHSQKMESSTANQDEGTIGCLVIFHRVNVAMVVVSLKRGEQ